MLTAEVPAEEQQAFGLDVEAARHYAHGNGLLAWPSPILVWRYSRRERHDPRYAPAFVPVYWMIYNWEIEVGWLNDTWVPRWKIESTLLQDFRFRVLGGLVSDSPWVFHLVSPDALGVPSLYTSPSLWVGVQKPEGDDPHVRRATAGDLRLLRAGVSGLL